MKTSDLYDILKKEGIHYINAKLSSSCGAIISYKGITAIIVDKSKIDSEAMENTVIIQELGHYFADSYYRCDSSLDFVESLEHKADVCAWLKFFPYKEIKFLRNCGLNSATSLASYFNVDVSYISRCLNFYYSHSNGFEDDDLFCDEKHETGSKNTSTRNEKD